MRKFFLCLLLLLLTTSVRAMVTGEEANKIDTLGNTTLVMEDTLPSLDKVMTAIIQVESSGNTRAFNPRGNCAGVLQITPGLVKQCNAWLKSEKSKKRYTLNDRYNRTKSIEMFYMYQSHFNPDNDAEKAIRIWNGGPGYTKKGTQRYYRKVMRYLE